MIHSVSSPLVSETDV